VGKEGKVRGSMTPVTGGVSRTGIKGRRSASIEAAMRKPRHHVTLFVDERRVGGKSCHVVEWAIGVV
jgi:hypothetical protein